jgi:hypothetical protein
MAGIDQMVGIPVYTPEHVAAYSAEYLAGIDLYNAREFHAAHDVWEERWCDDAGPREKLFLQGLIQTTIVFHYLELGLVGAARTMFDRAGEKFDLLGLDCAHSLDLTSLRAELQRTLAWLFVGPASEVAIPELFEAPVMQLVPGVTPALD